jgi:hypothetical protein
MKNENIAELLTELADRIAENYVSDGIDPNKLIKSFRERYNLNRNQTQRLIELTNRKIFLLQYNKNNKVIDFKMADPKKIFAEEEQQLEKKAFLSKEISEQKSRSILEKINYFAREKSFEVTPEEYLIKSAALKKKASEEKEKPKKSAAQFLVEKKHEEEKAISEINRADRLVKEAFDKFKDTLEETLQDYSQEEVLLALKPINYSNNFTFELIKKAFEQINPKLIKHASIDNRRQHFVNAEHDLIKQAILMDQAAYNFLYTLKKHGSLIGRMVKGIGSKLGELGKWVFSNPMSAINTYFSYTMAKDIGDSIKNVAKAAKEGASNPFATLIGGNISNVT